MKPDKQYTGRSRVQMFNCDCMEFMKGLEENAYDLSIVDPPYGNDSDVINKKNTKKHKAKRTQRKGYKNKKPDNNYFNELKTVSKKWIVWGGNYFNQVTGGVIAWNKNGTAFGEGEVAICSTHNSVRFYELTWNGMIQHDMKNKETRIHPHQKPVKLYRWILKNYANKNDKILDTHGGSMSLAIACWEEGFDLDICELDKDYFDDAIKHFETHISQKQLF